MKQAAGWGGLGTRAASWGRGRRGWGYEGGLEAVEAMTARRRRKGRGERAGDEEYRLRVTGQLPGRLQERGEEKGKLRGPLRRLLKLK